MNIKRIGIGIGIVLIGIGLYTGVTSVHQYKADMVNIDESIQDTIYEAKESDLLDEAFFDISLGDQYRSASIDEDLLFYSRAYDHVDKDKYQFVLVQKHDVGFDTFYDTLGLDADTPGQESKNLQNLTINDDPWKFFSSTQQLTDSLTTINEHYVYETSQNSFVMVIANVIVLDRDSDGEMYMIDDKTQVEKRKQEIRTIVESIEIF